MPLVHQPPSRRVRCLSCCRRGRPVGLLLICLGSAAAAACSAAFRLASAAAAARWAARAAAFASARARLAAFSAASWAGVLTIRPGISSTLHRCGFAITLPLGTTRKAGYGFARMPSADARRRALGVRQRIQLVLQIGLGVRQLGRLAIERPRLERLVLQCGVEHQQAGHADAEDADQHEKKGNRASRGGWAGTASQLPTGSS